MFPLIGKHSSEPNNRGTGVFIGLMFSLPLIVIAALTVYVVIALRVSKPLWSLIPLLCTIAAVVSSGVWWAKRAYSLNITAVTIAAVTQAFIWVLVYIISGAITVRFTLHDPHPFSDLSFWPLMAVTFCCALAALAMCFTIRWRIRKSVETSSQVSNA